MIILGLKFFFGLNLIDLPLFLGMVMYDNEFETKIEAKRAFCYL